MSTGNCPYTTVAALDAAKKFLGANPGWKGVDYVQSSWLPGVFDPLSKELPNIPEIESSATQIIAEHVAFLEKRGWKPQIQELKPNEFATAGVLDLPVAWTEKGQVVQVKTDDGTKYPGVKIPEAGVEIFTNPVYQYPVACLKTKSGDKVWITIMASPPRTKDLVSTAQNVFGSQTHPGIVTALDYSDNYAGLIFPMVDLTIKRSLDWISGLAAYDESGNKTTELAEAIQQLTLKMNEEGARARAADEMKFMVTSIRMPKLPLVINRPFLVSFERPGLTSPLFVAHVTEEDWKNPGDLGV